MKTIRCTVRLPSATAAGAILRRVGRVPGLVLTVLRARMTPVDARLELELTGSGSRIGRVLQMIPTEG